MQDNKIKELYNNIKNNTGNYEKYRKNNIAKKFLIFVIIAFILYLIIGLPLINKDNMYISYITAGIVVVGLIVFVIHKLSSEIKNISNITNKEKLGAKSLMENMKDLNDKSNLDKFAQEMMPISEELKELNKKVIEKENKNPFKAEYINNVLNPIIKEVFENSQYNPNEGLDHEIYVDGFEDRINEYMTNKSHRGMYNSENKIITKLDNKLELVMAEINSINYVAGEERTKPFLYGMAGYIKLPKKFDVSIKLKKHINYLLGQKTIVIPAFGADASQIKITEKDYFKTNIEILDKLYDIEVDSKEKASEILNNGFLIELSKIVQKYNIEFRFSIKDDMLYVWYGIDNKIFIPKKISEIEVEKIYKQFMNIKNISEEISNLILNE